MNPNVLKMNDDETKFIVFKSEHNINTSAKHNVHVGSTIVWSIDQTFSMQAHVNVFIIWET